MKIKGSSCLYNIYVCRVSTHKVNGVKINTDFDMFIKINNDKTCLSFFQRPIPCHLEQLHKLKLRKIDQHK